MLNCFLPLNLEVIVENEIQQNEEIIWYDQPLTLSFMMRNISLFIFSIFFLGFALFWTASAYTSSVNNNSGKLFLLFGTPFIILGAGMFFSPLYYLYLAKNTIYVITNYRAILIEKGFKYTIKSFSKEQLLNLKREQYKNGSGNLIFEQSISFNSEGSKKYTDIGFLCIRNVKKVEELLKKTIIKE